MTDWVCAVVFVVVALHVGWYANGFVRANQARKNAQAAARRSLPGLSWLRFKLFRQAVAWGALAVVMLLLFGWMKTSPPTTAPAREPSPTPSSAPR